MHNHDDYKVTNTIISEDASVYPGGQLTLIQTDAPMPNHQCSCHDEEHDDDDEDYFDDAGNMIVVLS